MPQNPAEFTRVSTPAGHFSVPSALVEAAGSEWKVLKQDAADSNGLPYPPKLREQSAAATSAEGTEKCPAGVETRVNSAGF